jgi:hypothetical protein
MNTIFIFLLVIAAIVAFVVLSKKKKASESPVIQVTVPKEEVVTESVNTTITTITQTVTPTTAEVIAPIIPQTNPVKEVITPIIDPVNDPWISHPTAVPTSVPIATVTPETPVSDPWVSSSKAVPDKWATTPGVTFDSNSNPTPQIVVNAMPSGGYGNWQGFRFDNPTEPWQQAFNTLATREPLVAFQWGFSHSNPANNDLKRAVDKWFFGSEVNPATGNSWPTSLGNKIIDLFGSDRGASTRGTLGINENWYPVEETAIAALLPKYPKTWTLTDEQYAQIPGIPPQEWNTPEMLKRFK